MLYLSIHFDILGKGGRRNMHFKIVITLLVLVAGLRWRVGSDTVVYAWDFIQYHDLFHLEVSDFELLNAMPLWVLLNSFCKTIWNNYVLVQLVTCFIHITLIGIFIKKVCPSLGFIMLLFYYFFEYIAWNMEASRHSLAVSFFLMSLLALNKKQLWITLFFWILSILSHVFSGFVIVVFVICYKLIKSSFIYNVICLFCIVIVTVNIKLISEYIGLIFVEIGGELGDKIYRYAVLEDSYYGARDFTWIRFLCYVIFLPILVLFMNKKMIFIYPKYFLFRKEIIDIVIYLYVIFRICSYSFGMFFRIADYFCVFFQIQCVIFLFFMIKKCVFRQRLLMSLLLFVVLFIGIICRYFGKAETGITAYRRYYPYSSVFDKTIDVEREKKDYQMRGLGGLDYTINDEY